MNRRFALTLCIAASLLPWRVAFACVHEPALIQQRCCCHEPHSIGRCPKMDGDSPAECCELVFTSALVADQDTLSPPSEPDAKSPPAVAGTHELQLVSRSVAAAARSTLPAPARWRSGSTIYLQTARLRL